MSDSAHLTTERNGLEETRAVAVQPHPRLRQLFSALEQRALRWTLLRLPSDLAAPTGDVDLLVAPADSDALRSAAEQLGFVALPGWESAPNLILVCYDRPSDCWLVLDVETTICFRRPRSWQPAGLAPHVLRRRQLRDGIALPADADAFWLLLFHCLLDKGAVAPRYRARLQRLAPTGLRSTIGPTVFAAAGDGWTPIAFTELVLAAEWQALEAAGGRLAADLNRRTALRARLRTLATRTVATARKPLLLPRRRGPNLALLGPNGVGKSTATLGLTRSLPFESRVIYMGVWKAAGGGPLRSVCEVLTRPLRIWYRYLLAQYHQCRSRIVIFDRYVYEARLPPQPPLLSAKRLYFWLLGHAIPAAQAAVVLDVPGPIAYRRKQENAPDELESERRFYGRLAGTVASLELVDASQDADAVRADITAIVWRQLTARWQGARARQQRGASVSNSDRGSTPPDIPWRPARSRGEAPWGRSILPRTRGARARRRLRDIRALVPGVLTTASRSLPGWARESVVARVELTSTNVAIVMLAPVDQPPCLVIKMPMTAEATRGLERESSALAALHADDRLHDWRNLLPRARAHGTVKAQPYRIDSAVRGRAVLDQVGDGTTPRRLHEAAAEAICFLHRTTAKPVLGDSQLAEHWIDAPLNDLSRRALRRGPFASRLERLREELHGAVIGRTFSAGWIHGDYWLGNLLFSGERSTVTGIVDWDAADATQLASHDLLHMLLYARRLATGRALGEIVREQLSSGTWSADERRLLDRNGVSRNDGPLSDRHTLLLYWLRHVALHARQQSRPAGYRYRVWELKNVHQVMATLWN